MLKKFEIVPFEHATHEIYSELGFKSGIEFHIQLLTKNKLFCRCPAGLYSEEYDAAILRHMRPTLSEMGTYDGTALMEFKKKKEVLYLLNGESVCTYEMDDTPPFLINEEAVEKATQIAMLLNCNIVGELHVMRKQYLDGSIPTGFQRTAVIGVNGEVPLEDGRVVRISQLNVEEDACREVSDIGHRITFRTDRLSMPLIEIITDDGLKDPYMAYLAGRRIQALTRASGLVRTGIGAARQDVNVSIAGGNRVEIKGVPKIPYFPKLLHYEAFRQKIFLDIKEEIAKRGILSSPDAIQFVELTANPIAIQVPLWRRAERIIGVVIRDFDDLFRTEIQIGRAFYDDVSSIVNVVACLDNEPNIIHSACPDIGGPTESQFKMLRESAGAKKNDVLVVVWGDKRDAEIGAYEIRDRIISARDIGVPNETRKAFPNGTTCFERVLPGADRMYPDTDHPPKPLRKEYLEQIRLKLPVSPWQMEKKWQKLGLSHHLIFELLHRRKGDLFDSICQNTNFKPSVIATHLTQTLVALRRKGVIKQNLDDIALEEIFNSLNSINAPNEAIPDAIELFAKEKNIARIIEQFKPIDETTARKIIKKVIDEQKHNAISKNCESQISFFMGIVMKELRGKIAGAKVRNIVKELVNT